MLHCSHPSCVDISSYPYMNIQLVCENIAFVLCCVSMREDELVQLAFICHFLFGNLCTCVDHNNNECMFFCCTEVVADDTKAIDAVVNADKKRLALIEERQQLEAQKGKQGEHQGERLKEVQCQWCACYCTSMQMCDFCIVFNSVHFAVLIFTARRYASAVLPVIVCLSVRLSVRLSQVRVVQRWLNIG